MPFKSKSQARWMFSEHPAMARRWAAETPSIKRLPQRLAGGGPVSIGGGDVDTDPSVPGGDPKLDIRSRVLGAINKRIQQQSSLESAARASMDITSRFAPGRRVTLPHLSNPYASQYMASTPFDTMLGYGRYPTPEMQSRGYAEGGAVRPSQRDVRIVDNDIDRRNSREVERIGDLIQRSRAIARGAQYAEGGEVDDESFARRHPIMAGAGLAGAGAAMHPRFLNFISRPVMRALARPALGIEAVSKHPLSEGQSDARMAFARDAIDHHPFSHLPVWKGQGAWQGDKGMEYNPLYVQELPRVLGKMRNADMHTRYAAQMGENLEQAATPLSRFVPHLMNVPDDANALMAHGIDRDRLRMLAEKLGGDVVTAHRPGNRAMMFPLDDRPISALADQVKGLGVPKVRYGRSDPVTDRMLLSREPLGFEDGLYKDFGAEPRSGMYDAMEQGAIRHPLPWALSRQPLE